MKFELFGFVLQTDFPLKTRLQVAVRAADISFRCSVSPPEDWVGQSAALIYASPVTKDNIPLMGVYRSADYDLLTFADIAHFYVGPSRIYCHLLKPEYQFLVEIRLLGPVMSHWLEMNRFLVFHASSIMVGDRAVAFTAPSKGGKTSVLASFLKAGHALLTDDVLPVQLGKDGVSANPGYPQMRFWPDQITRFIGPDRSTEGFERIHPNYDKWRIPVGSGVFGSFHRQPSRLAVIYILDRVESGAKPSLDISFEAVGGARGVFELANGFFLKHSRHMPGQKRKLQELGTLTGSIPVRRLTYPSGYELLPRLRKAVLRDVDECSLARQESLE